MYVTPRQKQREVTITIIIAILIPFTAIAAYFVTRYFIGASGETKPEGVVISNLTSNALTVNWTTQSTTSGSLTVDKNGKSSSPYLDIRGSDRRKTHSVDIIDLEPNTDYSFTIQSNNEKYRDEGGSSFAFKTAPITIQTPVPNPIYGSIKGANDNDNVVFVIHEDSDAYPASTVSSASGNWIVDLSALRDQSANPIEVSSESNLTLIVIGKDGLGSYLSGTYSELFDGEGKLRDSSALSLTQQSNIIGRFPKNSVISTVKEVYTYTPPTPTPTPTPTPAAPEPEPEPEPEIDVTKNRKFRIVSDVTWTPISGTLASTSSSVDLITGEDSVLVTNITDTGFNVLWVSGSIEEGSVDYGKTADSLGSDAQDERDGLAEKNSYRSHSIKVTKLQPETKYYFEIHSGETTIDNGGKPFEVTTFATLSSPPEFKTISGKLSGISSPEDSVIFGYIKNSDESGSTGDSTYTSGVPDENGNWVITFGDMRNSDGSEYYNSSDDDVFIVSAKLYSSITPVEEVMKDIESKTVLLSTIDDVPIGGVVKVVKLGDYKVY